MMKNILAYLDSEIQEYYKINPNYIFFRIGSSLFHNEIPCDEIDFIIIDTKSEIDYSHQIDNFQKQFSNPFFSKSTIETFDKNIDKLFWRIQTSILDKFKVHLNHVFGFGPISTSVNTITLHLAGPMNIKSAKYFYDKFPIFYMAFSKYNKKLSVTSFENLFIAPQYGIVELKRAIKEIIIRSKNTNSDTIKLQCLRRIKLIELIYKNRSHPYLKAYNHVKNLNHYEILMELENYEKA